MVVGMKEVGPRCSASYIVRRVARLHVILSTKHGQTLTPFAVKFVPYPAFARDKLRPKSPAEHKHALESVGQPCGPRTKDYCSKAEAGKAQPLNAGNMSIKTSR